MVRPKALVPKGQLKILDKLKIIKLHAEEPKIGMRKFTDLVETKLGLTASRATVQRILKTKENLLAIPEHYWRTRCRSISEVQCDFEKKLYIEFVKGKKRTGFNYETIKTLAFKLLRDCDEYDRLRGNLRFSNSWFHKWLKTYKVGWAIIHGTKKYFPKEVIDGHRAEYREKIQDFPPQHCYNFDESAFLHSWLGKMSYIPMNGVDEDFVEKGSDRLRMTAGSFTNVDGSDNYQSFIVKSFPMDLRGKSLSIVIFFNKGHFFWLKIYFISQKYQKGTEFLAQKFCPFFSFIPFINTIAKNNVPFSQLYDFRAHWN